MADLQLGNLSYHFVFPAYGPDFRDMSRWTAYWEEVLPGQHHFWPGFDGGGVLAISTPLAVQARHSVASANISWTDKQIYGLVLGNEGGRELAASVSCALNYTPPAFAVRMGLAERVPDPTVPVTAEHAEGLDGARYLLVVPKANRKSVRLMEHLPAWFAAFGVTVELPSSDMPEMLRAAIHDWFDDPNRPMLATPMSGGEGNAAWQLAVAYYVSEYWDTKARGLDTIHVVADIEGRPNFRKYWTSNR